MLGFILLMILVGIEVGYMLYCLKKGAYDKEKRSYLRLGVFVAFVLLILIDVIILSFRWYLLVLLLLIKALTGIWFLARRNLQKEKKFTRKSVILSGIGNIMLYSFVLFSAILFPQFKPVESTGDYQVATVSYTLTDPDRMETFSDTQENRKVTVQFWYPEDTDGQYPLVVFSHGAFGFRGSDRSTFENLASNGYVVCSIDHTYHSFFTKQTDGNVVIADMNFINNAMGAQNDAFDEEATYQMSHEWLALRLGDVDFVLNTILQNVADNGSDEVYQVINTEKIGVFGHSLGGATSAEIGRERTDIDAVVVVDGTMFGEEVGFKNGEAVLNQEPYPVPLLNIYNEEHFDEANQLGEKYDNISATKNALDANQTVFKGAGHLNFTDLPMFSPILAGMLGTGEINSRYCVETMNQVILNYFNYYLKNAEELNIQAEY